ncbi:6-pyruvoyl trahydropterin synthase family protein [Nesterenkonia halotolerans]|uniref:6-carboxy-5,6,7,8-tetrahydropterin synthase n=1 Tax=Nesterenkonia halotolerans TaxID=225325 RepID=A0ABR9J5I7_9MICC|nr:6-carboxytetrahydropterin synthase [Nesterenkonia halotolerans]MBE1514180.1 6-pyruvoyl-tetrahydropterin synthase [Nesterenkonia halotolerans]
MSRFRLTVDDHIMIAHSLNDPFFGPAQNLHGATLSIQASFFRDSLNEFGVVMDIGAASELLASTLEPLRYQNLDELEEFRDRFTTTEVIIEHIAQRLAAGLPAGHGLSAVEVEAEEHPRARASVRVQL